MTHLRKMMLEELQRLNYAQNTTRHYLRAVEAVPPIAWAFDTFANNQAELFQKRKLSANSVGQHLAALRFLYSKTLKRAWSIAETPYPKRMRHFTSNSH